MKKTLLTSLLIVSGCFFAYAENDAVPPAIIIPIDAQSSESVPPAIIIPNSEVPPATIILNTQVPPATIIPSSNTSVPPVTILPASGVQSSQSVGVTQSTSGIMGLIGLVQEVMNRLVPIMVGLAVLAFFWFVVVFVWMAKDNPDEQIKARSGMGYSILAIFVMVSIWGIISFIGNTFGIAQGGSAPAFKVPGE